jgi:hypothetical protein
MDTYWAFREAQVFFCNSIYAIDCLGRYNKARKLKLSQDEYCSKAENGQWDSIDNFPEDLQWEALVDVLRSRVKVHIHCYEVGNVNYKNLLKLNRK